MLDILKISIYVLTNLMTAKAFRCYRLEWVNPFMPGDTSAPVTLLENNFGMQVLICRIFVLMNNSPSNIFYILLSLEGLSPKLSGGF